MIDRTVPDESAAGQSDTDGDTYSDTESDAGESGPGPMDLAAMRETARQVMVAHEPGSDLDGLSAAMRGFVRLLVPALRTLIAARPSGDRPAMVARVGVDEAWRRLHTTPGLGPGAAHRRARRLALSVLSLCDHYENLRPTAAASAAPTPGRPRQAERSRP